MEPDRIIFKNKPDLTWQRMLPELGDDSPIFALLRVDPRTDATTLMIEFPSDLHLPKHTHEKSETHVLLGGAHVFEDTASGTRYDVRQDGYIYMPGKFVHEAWVPAGSRAVIILEGGWRVDWVDGPPTARDLGRGAPPR